MSSGLTVVNGYGPTETTTFGCTTHIMSTAAERLNGRSRSARPIDNTRVYVLDDGLSAGAGGSRR